MLGVLGLLRDSYKLSKHHFVPNKKNIWGIIHLVGLVSFNLIQIWAITNLHASQGRLISSMQCDDDTIISNLLKLFGWSTTSTALVIGANLFTQGLVKHIFVSLTDEFLEKWLDPRLGFRRLKISGGIGPPHVIAKDLKNFGYYTADVVTKFLDGLVNLIAGVIRIGTLSPNLLFISLAYAIGFSLISGLLSKKLTKIFADEEKNTSTLYDKVGSIAQSKELIRYRQAEDFEKRQLQALRGKILGDIDQANLVKPGLTLINEFTIKSITGLGVIFSFPARYMVHLKTATLEEIGKHGLGIMKFFFLEIKNYYTTTFLRTLIDRITGFKNELDSVLSGKGRSNVVYIGDDIVLSNVEYRFLDHGVAPRYIFNNANLTLKWKDDATGRTNIYKITGDNGTGKSTLIGMLLGDYPEKGTISLPKNSLSSNVIYVIPQGAQQLMKQNTLEESIFYPHTEEISTKKRELEEKFRAAKIYPYCIEDDIIRSTYDYLTEKHLDRFFYNHSSDSVKTNKEILDRLRVCYTKSYTRASVLTNIETYKESVSNLIFEMKKAKVKSLFTELGHTKLVERFENKTRYNSADTWGRLSGGEMQVVKIVQALVSDPRPLFLFMDESFAGIDRNRKDTIKSIIRRELPETAIIFVDHEKSDPEVFVEELPQSPIDGEPRSPFTLSFSPRRGMPDRSDSIPPVFPLERDISQTWAGERVREIKIEQYGFVEKPVTPLASDSVGNAAFFPFPPVLRTRSTNSEVAVNLDEVAQQELADRTQAVKSARYEFRKRVRVVEEGKEVREVNI